MKGKILKKKEFFIISIIFCFILISLVLIYKSYTEIVDYKGIKYDNREYQKDFIDEITRENIPFYLGEDDQIYYSEVDQNKIDKIIDRLDNRPSIVFENPDNLKKLMSILKGKKINFKLRKLGLEGDIYILWEEKDDTIVKTIINETFYKM